MRDTVSTVLVEIAACRLGGVCIGWGGEGGDCLVRGGGCVWG